MVIFRLYYKVAVSNQLFWGLSAGYGFWSKTNLFPRDADIVLETFSIKVLEKPQGTLAIHLFRLTPSRQDLRLEQVKSFAIRQSKIMDN